MGFIPCPNAVEVSMRGTLAARISWQSSLVIDFSSSLPLTQTNANGIADIFGDAWEDSGILGQLSTGWTLDEYVITDLTTSGSPQFTSTHGTQVGTNGAQVLPGQTQAMIDWRTATRGRSFRGRTFFVGFTEADSDGTPSATVQTNLNTWASGLLGDLNSGSIPLVVLSRFSGTHLVPGRANQILSRPLPRASGIMTPIVSGTAEEVWKTQRRRAFPG